MDLGAHEHMFSYAMHVSTWYEQLVSEREEVIKHEQVLECEEPATQMMIASEVAA